MNVPGDFGYLRVLPRATAYHRVPAFDFADDSTDIVLFTVDVGCVFMTTCFIDTLHSLFPHYYRLRVCDKRSDGKG
jgi:hypothetical protein